MKYGLTDDEFKFLIKELILPIKKIGATVYIFGSRATGKYQKFSDIDLLYQFSEPSTVQTLQVNELLEKLVNSNFIYKIDLVDLQTLAESYKNSVLNERIKL